MEVKTNADTILEYYFNNNWSEPCCHNYTYALIEYIIINDKSKDI